MEKGGNQYRFVFLFTSQNILYLKADCRLAKRMYIPSRSNHLFLFCTRHLKRSIEIYRIHYEIYLICFLFNTDLTLCRSFIGTLLITFIN